MGSEIITKNMLEINIDVISIDQDFFKKMSLTSRVIVSLKIEIWLSHDPIVVALASIHCNVQGYLQTKSQQNIDISGNFCNRAIAGF